MSADANIVRALVRGLVRAGAEHISWRLEPDGSATMLADGEVVLRGIDILALRASLTEGKLKEFPRSEGKGTSPPCPY